MLVAAKCSGASADTMLAIYLSQQSASLSILLRGWAFLDRAFCIVVIRVSQYDPSLVIG